MSNTTNADRELKNAISRFIREYNNEVLFLKDQLQKERRRVRKLEETIIKKGGDDND